MDHSSSSSSHQQRGRTSLTEEERPDTRKRGRTLPLLPRHMSKTVVGQALESSLPKRSRSFKGVSAVLCPALPCVYHFTSDSSHNDELLAVLEHGATHIKKYLEAVRRSHKSHKQFEQAQQRDHGTIAILDQDILMTE